jgi:hypothetical protein
MNTVLGTVGRTIIVARHDRNLAMNYRVEKTGQALDIEIVGIEKNKHGVLDACRMCQER